MRGSRGSTVGGGNVVKPPLTLQLEDAKTQGFSSYSNTYPFNYLFGDKELLARQVASDRQNWPYVSRATIIPWMEVNRGERFLFISETNKGIRTQDH